MTRTAGAEHRVAPGDSEFRNSGQTRTVGPSGPVGRNIESLPATRSSAVAAPRDRGPRVGRPTLDAPMTPPDPVWHVGFV